MFAACLHYAVRQRWIPANPLAEVKRHSNRAARERVLRREDFYDPDEVARLLSHAPDVFHERSGSVVLTPACASRARPWGSDDRVSDTEKAAIAEITGALR